jgi:pilus assembly protein CpaF
MPTTTGTNVPETSRWQFARSNTPDIPSAGQRYQQIKAEIHKVLVESVDVARLNRWQPDRLRREVQALADTVVANKRESLSQVERERLVQELLDEVFGLGPLEPLLRDGSISDILVNGPRSVYIERGGRLEETNVQFADDDHVLRIIQRIAARVGRRVDEASPMVDARLPDGSRVNAILSPLSLEGPVLSIRRFGSNVNVESMLQNGTMTREMFDLLKAAVAGRINILISGGTGAGKTTLLNALSQFIPADERLVTIEDSAELKLKQPHVVRLETRVSNLEGVGEVNQRSLLRNSLRMRPDRIIIGEVRGAEALDMLQAMNTGHEGSLTTIHANDSRDALNRLELMVAMSGLELPVQVMRGYIASAITMVVQLARLKGGARRIVRISEILGLKAGKRYVVKDLFTYEQIGLVNGQATGHFRATGHIPRFLTRLKASGQELPEWLFAERQLAMNLG